MKLKQILFLIGVLAVLLMPLFTYAQDVTPPVVPDKTDPTEATNPAPGEEIPYVAQVVKWSNALYNLPAIPLVVLGCIMVGYFAKLVPIIPNGWIPAIVFLAGIVANLVMTPLNSGPDWGRAIILGLVAGGGSIFVHRKWLKDWIDIDVFGDLGKPPKVGLFLLCGFLSFGLTGCAWFQPEKLKPVAVAEGHDPYLVNAERIHKSSLGVYRILTEWELAQRANLPASVSRAVDKVRAEFKPAWVEADTILQDYRDKRGISTNDLERVTAALAAAQSSMLRLKADQTQVTTIFSSITDLTSAVGALRKP